ncbi:ABC-2 type transport system permease protein [Gordonia malaquae]|uniref:Transport permease protein n=1 Tax=Gordonia malaquae NBRC 108250 TaxID=1223542 RepID=M3V061_GORML|nr:ABC transporter permease [Gordonia malaquae]GAC81742.1 putative ABC transporter permease protein [Gordonia malaquae NBRC 108250]SEB72302.1 ABC-2 type transport system permease protein [Gordonia malaquae]
MSAPIRPRILGATAVRVLRQLRADPRTIALVLVVPILLMTLLYFMYSGQSRPPGAPDPFQRVGVVMLGILPFVTMFLITSIAMLRERRSGTLERLLTTPIGKLDLLGGYGVAFSVVAAVQAVLASAVAFGLLGLEAEGSVAWVIVIAMLDAMLGVALGLLCSAFAQTEFQAVQFLPVVVIPQLFLCGLFVPRDQLPGWMEALSDVMPLTYAVQALQEVASHPTATALMWRDTGIVAACIVVALSLAAATLRRRTP